LKAARYIESELRRMNVASPLPGGSYLQTVPLLTPRLAASPVVKIAAPSGAMTWTMGQEALIVRNPHSLSGPLLRVTDADRAPGDKIKGAVVFLDTPNGSTAAVAALGRAGAVAVFTIAPPAMAAQFSAAADAWARSRLADAPAPVANALNVLIKSESATALRQVADGAIVKVLAEALPLEPGTTQNVLGVIRGSARDGDKHAILLSAHYDHLGMRGGTLYPGANDDASGTAAVMEFARLLKAGPLHKRTVYLALFGCEESGELGSDYFRTHLPMALADLSANLEFEMIGYPDPKRPDTLMMTGWDRTNLGPTLVAHGAKLGDDPYPEQNFFQRSDNYQLARQGVVAQTTSGWPLPPTYHQPDDDLDHVDIHFMTLAIQSLVEPMHWWLNSDFTPEWLPGKKP
jgi:aminopeptidase YwaD